MSDNINEDIQRKIYDLQAGQIAQQCNNDLCYGDLLAVVVDFKRRRPNDLSELDRIYAVTITELEKALGYFYHATNLEVDREVNP